MCELIGSLSLFRCFHLKWFIHSVLLFCSGGRLCCPAGSGFHVLVNRSWHCCVAALQMMFVNYGCDRFAFLLTAALHSQPFDWILLQGKYPARSGRKLIGSILLKFFPHTFHFLPASFDVRVWVSVHPLQIPRVKVNVSKHDGKTQTKTPTHSGQHAGVFKTSIDSHVEDTVREREVPERWVSDKDWVTAN